MLGQMFNRSTNDVGEPNNDEKVGELIGRLTGAWLILLLRKRKVISLYDKILERMVLELNTDYHCSLIKGIVKLYKSESHWNLVL